MSSTRQLYELARRDFSQRARSRAFLISTLITVGLVLAAGPLIAFVNSGPNPSVVAAVGDLSPEVRDALATEAAALEIEIIVENHPNLEAAEKTSTKGLPMSSSSTAQSSCGATSRTGASQRRSSLLSPAWSAHCWQGTLA